MNILICPDKFKYTFSAAEIANVISQVVTKLGHKTLLAPLSDGGEGFLDVINQNLNVQRIETDAVDALWRPLKSYFLWAQAQKYAYIELAVTSSLQLLAPTERNPMNTTSFGLGLQVKQAIRLGAEKIYIGLGGSSTTDMGIGMAAALDYRFVDWQHNVVLPIGRNLIKIQHISSPDYSWPQITACVDVDNPLFGPHGAAYVYSPQKGANKEETVLLDRGLRNIAAVVYNEMGISLNTTPGEGAAGGLGAGIKAFFHGRISAGTDIIFSITGLEEKMHWADIVITGEGSFDSQSLQGKVTGKVIELSRQYDKPVIVVAGQSHIKNSENVTVASLFDNNVDMNIARKLTPQKIKEKLPEALTNI